MERDPRLQLVLEQLEIILVLLERPIVQRQLVVLGITLLLAWLIAAGWRQLVRRSAPTWRLRLTEQRYHYVQRGLTAMEQLNFPLAALLLLQVTIWILRDLERPFGLLSGGDSVVVRAAALSAVRCRTVRLI